MQVEIRRGLYQAERRSIDLFQMSLLFRYSPHLLSLKWKSESKTIVPLRALSEVQEDQH